MIDSQHHPVGFAPGDRSWKHLPRILPYLRRYRHLAVISCGMLFVGVIISLLEPWPMAFLVDGVLGSRSSGGVVTELVGTDKRKLVIVAAAAGLLLALMSNGLHVVNEYVNTKLDTRLRLDFRRDLFTKAQQLSLSYHDTHRAGYFAQNINTHTTALGLIVVDIPPLVQSVLTLVGMFVIAYLLDPLVAVLALGVVPFIYYSTVFYSKHIEPRLIKTRDEEGLSLSVVHEAMSMLRVILAFRREDHELGRFTRQAEHAIGLRVNVTVKQTLFSLAVNVITAAGSALVLAVGAIHVLDHRLTVGELLVMMGYIASVYRPLQTISYTMGAWQEHLVDFWLALELLDQQPEIVEREDAVDLAHVQGRVTFEGACFSYPNRVNTICDVSFDIPAGSVVAIVGPTGAGKSTVTNLIPRLYEVSAGRVLLDGHDVRDLTLDSLRQNVALVQQEPMLFLATIADNIRYGRLDASIEEVKEAATQANADDFIMALPDKYDTKLGERGSMLSGGERQRICIARAFLKDAPILILDEPTSSIDSRTERVILDALDRLMIGRTTFIVAHRLSTIGRADLILVLDGGRLVEQGTHDELFAIDKGLYRQLWQAQLGRHGATRPPPSALSALPAAGSASVSEPTPAPAAPAPAAPAPATASAVPAPTPTPPAPAPVSVPRPVPTVAIAGRPKAVVLGMMTKMPVAGVVWQTVHYLIGLERLGYDAYYVEAHARTPSMLMTRDTDDSTALAASFIERVMRRFGLEHRWAFQALHDDGRCVGMTDGELSQLYAAAAVILNLHGGTEPRPEHYAGNKLVYLESDPCQLQVELLEGRQRTLDFLQPHSAFFTFGENLGRPDCLLPATTGFPFVPTRQPVLVDLWEARGVVPRPTFTTIANWRQAWREVQFEGETYTWSKHLEFLKFLDLPARSGVDFELALSSFEDADRKLLESKGWGIREGLEVSRNIDSYRAFVAGSMAEFTVAKDQNVRLRSGWFSDRSATYLAAGRPVVTQDTGFGSVLPTGNGLHSFTSLDDAAEAVERICSDYPRQSRAANQIAHEFFDADVVLGAMLDHLGLPHSGRSRARAVPIPGDLVLTPESRRPLVLPEATRASVLARPAGAPTLIDEGPPVATVVVVTFNNLVCTRLCLESALGAGGSTIELIVVDNGSTDGTPAYLNRLAAVDPRVRVLANDENRGFAAAVNQGAAVGRAGSVVILNNDVVVAPGWLDTLLAHLTDPAVGAVGPLTGRIGNEAEIELDYDSYAAFVERATERALSHAGRSFEIPMLALFCTAFRREVLETVGPLDEGFGLGLFEDDDYAERLRAAGYRLRCAEDVYVHHFGEATFGDLVASGEYGALFEQNRRLFELKWGVTWQQHARRPDPAYAAMVGRIHTLAREVLPPEASVLVVSRGDADLLDLGCRAEHFPQSADGAWIGYHPGSSDDAIDHMENLHAGGATHFLVPATAMWWFDHYRGLADHLDQRAEVVARNDDCVLFSLAGRTASLAGTDSARSRL